MPDSRSLRWPASVIQSVVQAGDSTVRTRAPSMPALRQRRGYVERDDRHRRTARIGRRDGHHDAVRPRRNVAQHAEIGDGERRIAIRKCYVSLLLHSSYPSHPSNLLAPSGNERT